MPPAAPTATLLPSPRPALPQGVGVTLAPGQARTLRVPASGVLSVTEGALWVTRRASRRHPWPDDLCVTVGQPLALRPGESVVIEPMHARQPATFQWQAGRGQATHPGWRMKLSFQ